MIIVDSNIIIYSYEETRPDYLQYREWLQAARDRSLLAIPWVSAWSFLRVVTNRKLWAHPANPAKAFGYLSDLRPRGTMIPEPGQRHTEILQRLVEHHHISGPAMTDAVLAALAIEHNATLASTDRDFRRFEGLRYLHPFA